MAGTISDYAYDPLTRTGSFKCTFPEAGALSNVTVTAFDDDGAADTDNQLVQVTVNNVAPCHHRARARRPPMRVRNHTFDLGSFTDPGTDTPWPGPSSTGVIARPISTFNEASSGLTSPTPPTPTLTTAPTRSPSRSPRRPAA